MPRLLQVVLIALVIPGLGFLVATWILFDVDRELATADLPSLQEICAQDGASEIDELSDACAELSGFLLLRGTSLAAAFGGIAIPVLFWIGSAYAGRSRKRLLKVFPLLIRVSVVLLSAVVLVQGAVLTYAIYVAESYFLGRIHLYLIGAIAIGALIGAFGLISALRSLGKKLESRLSGRHLSREQAPTLFDFVHRLAEKLGARPPDHVIVGLEPTFFVTSADLRLAETGERLAGQSLYLSAPLCRLFSRDEFAAVLGHELGHFRGGDTEYSLRFAPLYAGLGRALQGITAREEDSVASALAKIPAISILSYMVEVFATNERTIGRDREFLADQAATEVASPLALATALVKVSLYAAVWEHARGLNVQRLNEGKVSKNLSAVFQDVARYDVEQESIEEIKGQVLEARIAHPTDTHPPTRERLEALGVSPSEITKGRLLVPDNPAIELLDKADSIERELTADEHNLMVAVGLATLPADDTQRKDYALQATYALAAAMVGADGRIDAEEMAKAEKVGAEIVSGFDAVDFREICADPDCPDIQTLAGFLAGVLTSDYKSQILDYLEAIARADGEVSPEERELLQLVTTTLQGANNPNVS